SKKKILELYLNQMYFGHGVYGIEEASQLFFSKSVKQLTISEGALLAGLAKSPIVYSPIDYPEKASNRRNTVLYAMEQMGVISTETRLEERSEVRRLETEWRTQCDLGYDDKQKE